MSHRMNTVSTSVLLVAGALLVGVGVASLHARAAPPTGEGREDLNELKKRVAKREADVAEMRKALRQAGGGTPDAATDLKNVREGAKLRSADLLQRAQNTHALWRDVMENQGAGRALPTRINDLNNELTSLGIVRAGYGLARDPSLDPLRRSDSGSGRAKPPPDHGIPGPYVGIGLPRLHERYLEASGAKGQAAAQRSSEFRQLVQAYSNPAVNPHRVFNERADGEYREGKGRFTAPYLSDRKTVGQGLTDLEAVLGKVPGCFEKAP